MVAPIGETGGPGEPPLPTGVPASQIRAAAPGILAWLRLRRNKVALVVRRRCSCSSCCSAWRRRCGPNTSRTPGRTRTTSPRRCVINGQPTNVVRTRRHAARARAARAVPARRGPERPRRDGAADVRRPDVDLHRPGGRRRHHGAVRDRRPARRLLPRLDRLGAVAGDGRDLGLPGAAPRHRVGHRAGHRRSQGRAPRDRRRLDLDSDPDHRLRLRAVHGQTDQGRNSGAA